MCDNATPNSLIFFFSNSLTFYILFSYCFLKTTYVYYTYILLNISTNIRGLTKLNANKIWGDLLKPKLIMIQFPKIDELQYTQNE